MKVLFVGLPGVTGAVPYLCVCVNGKTLKWEHT